jgi:cytochrome c oxidase subunit II
MFVDIALLKEQTGTHMRRSLFVSILFAAVLLSIPAFPVETTAAGSQTINILAKQYEFVPDTIEVKRGVPVSLIFTGQYVTQRVIISAFKINVAVEKGSETAVSFTPDRSGTFDYFGTAFPGFCHKGLRGKLIVTD